MNILGALYDCHCEFFDWEASYLHGTMAGRAGCATRYSWLKLSCPVIVAHGDVENAVDEMAAHADLVAEAGNEVNSPSDATPVTEPK